MSSPLIGARYLAEDSEAREFHEAGLEFSLSGQFEQARELFKSGKDVLYASRPDDRTTDTVVQGARIMRDEGFSYVREAIAHDSLRRLGIAKQIINQSIETTAPIVSGTNISWFALPKHQTVKKARREVFSEHGATVSLLGRIATVESVLMSIDTRQASVPAKHMRNIDQQAYGLAHDLLRRGTNGYYRVSNAMTGARQERLNGRLPHTVVWLGRAAYGLAWTALRDPRNLKDAVLTAGSRTLHLRGYKAALKSVTVKP